ncbi:GNAT family N-acetyltransferase [Bacillus cytotoxicus]|uniref:GNAT family N-acetyltransferase n=1 Tax=Bacillus cytotoxicus TaxID=580165 RepID=UPI0035CAD27A
MEIRLAQKEDLDWVNHQYRSVGFVPSNLIQDRVAIITYNGKQAGLGRLVHIDERTIEMDSIYILPTYRGRQLAGRLVSFLVRTAKESKVPHVYCIPFEELGSFYKKYGFQDIDIEKEDMHPTIIAKYKWRLQEYDKHVL